MTTKESRSVSDPQLIVPLRPDGAATPLYCVHSSSGSAYSYLGLAGLIGADRPVYGIEAPGFDNGRRPVPSVSALSAEYAGLLQQVRPQGDFLLLGWSFGGMVALETARLLAAAGADVRQVVLIDASAPSASPLPPEREILRRFLVNTAAALGAEATAEVNRLLAGQPETAAPGTVLAAVARSGALPFELDAGLLAEQYAVFRAHAQAAYAFEPTEPYRGPVAHLVASESQHEPGRWEEVAPALTEYVVPGGHHSIWRGDGLQRLAGLTRAVLAGTAGRAAPGQVPGVR